MKTAEKNRQRLTYSQGTEPNAKYGTGKRWKVNLNSIQEFVDYMDDDNDFKDD